jgi:pimeloyl-ACP methyl ester carboxylesterase
VSTDEAVIEFGSLGTGTPVVMVPGRGGAGTEQFVALGTAVAAAGYRAVAINLRGVGLSRGPLENLTLHDFARDVAAVVTTVGSPAHVVGRAIGNRVARCLAVDHPETVKSLCLIAAGGLVTRHVDTPPSGNKRNPPPGLRLTHWQQAGIAQMKAAKATSLEDWWSGGEAPMLVIQGLDDRTAVPENGYSLRREYPDRVRLRDVPNSGHLVLYEQPNIVIPEILTFLADVEEGRDIA